jgi:hypothetical protein
MQIDLTKGRGRTIFVFNYARARITRLALRLTCVHARWCTSRDLPGCIALPPPSAPSVSRSPRTGEKGTFSAWRKEKQPVSSRDGSSCRASDSPDGP